MSVRRQVARVVTVGALLGALVAAGALPAHADEDRVRVRASGSFSAGGSPGGVSIEVRKRTDGCVLLRTGLGLSLAGVGADQVRVEVNVGGRWSTVPVSGGGGVLQVSRTPSAGPPLCRGKGSTVRYRVAFLAGTPGGRLDVVGEATTAVGRLIGRGADTSRVGGRAAGSPTPSSTPTRKPTPTPTPDATTPAPTTATAGAALAAPAAGPAGTAAAETSGGSMTMFAGIALVILGAGLIALLIFRSRADRAAVDPGRAADPVDLPVLPQPRNPGPTTYRSGGAAGAPAPAGQVYGQPQPPAPARPGGLYGAPAAYPTVTPTPRPAGGVYGSRPASAPPVQGGPVSAPPASTPPVSAPPAPGRPASPPATGGEATTIMPDLPG
ncbi:hypothetical protein [Micromonospora sp. HUAS LYJ1]|uniref:hypothetical protein n=1 Tax=Micromonospora sp. HUAS LYJ1 TaxID=3061626 RepID=UPI0026735DE7|nr:hypothetical protein [Micromonospora sp. HUAS LYJ1]WKU04285.1 hypothetical protein Q2K16_26285 [Micromonospora sp. HUAS LYJ1]